MRLASVEWVKTKIEWYKNETCISRMGLRQRLNGTRMRLTSVEWSSDRD